MDTSERQKIQQQLKVEEFILGSLSLFHDGDDIIFTWEE